MQGSADVAMLLYKSSVYGYKGLGFFSIYEVKGLNNSARNC